MIRTYMSDWNIFIDFNQNWVYWNIFTQLSKFCKNIVTHISGQELTVEKYIFHIINNLQLR